MLVFNYKISIIINILIMLLDYFDFNWILSWVNRNICLSETINIQDKNPTLYTNNKKSCREKNQKFN